MADLKAYTDPKLLTFVSMIVVLVSAINCGLMGLLGVNIIGQILGALLGRLIFIIFGLAAGYLLYVKYVLKQNISF